MRDFVIHLSHKAGELGRVANILGRVGVNIKSLAAMSFGNQATVRIIADNVDAARSALKEFSINFEESELVTVLMENRAGELANLADKLAAAGLNLHALYVVGLEGDLVDLAIAVDDVKKAKKIVEEL